MTDQRAQTHGAAGAHPFSGSAPDDVFRPDAPAANDDTVVRGEIRPVQPAPAPSASVPAASSARPASAQSAPRPAGTARSGAGRRTRKARLRLSRIDPWSVMKTSFLFSVAGGIMFWVATYVIWSVIGASGLFDAINEAIVSILSSPNDQTPIRVEDFVNTNKVLGIAALVAVINVIILTALGTLGSFLYNLSANILGGLELTLAED